MHKYFWRFLLLQISSGERLMVLKQEHRYNVKINNSFVTMSFHGDLGDVSDCVGDVRRSLWSWWHQSTFQSCVLRSSVISHHKSLGWVLVLVIVWHRLHYVQYISLHTKKPDVLRFREQVLDVRPVAAEDGCLLLLQVGPSEAVDVDVFVYDEDEKIVPLQLKHSIGSLLGQALRVGSPVNGCCLSGGRRAQFERGLLLGEAVSWRRCNEKVWHLLAKND